MILIVSSFSLLVIVAGMFLLAKTQKDNLSNFFKYVSYFVIIVGFLNLFAGGVHMILGHFYKQCAMEYEMQHGKKSKHGKHAKMMMFKHMSGEDGMMNEEKCMMMNDEKCSMGKEKCMDMEKCGESGGMMNGKSCCKEKMMMKKDTVIIKK
jgi:energy-coupling factor transporter transmembrane protein EcfT